MRFVEEDLVGESGAPAQRVEQRQHRSQVLAASMVRHVRQIDDHAEAGMAERACELPRARRRILSAERDDAGQVAERLIVPLGIDDAQAVALQDQLFAEQPRQPRLAAARFAGDQDRPSADGESHGFAVVLASQHADDDGPFAPPTTVAAR